MDLLGHDRVLDMSVYWRIFCLYFPLLAGAKTRGPYWYGARQMPRPLHFLHHLFWYQGGHRYRYLYPADSETVEAPCQPGGKSRDDFDAWSLAAASSPLTCVTPLTLRFQTDGISGSLPLVSFEQLTWNIFKTTTPVRFYLPIWYFSSFWTLV